MAWVTIANVRGPRGPIGPQGRPGDISFRLTSDLPTLNVEDWIGTDLVGIYRFPTGVTAQTVINRPAGADDAAFVTVLPIASGGSLIKWTEYGGLRRTFEKVVSTSSTNRTQWKRVDRSTRTALHQLSMPSSNALNDTEKSRHVRLPVKFFTDVDTWELVFKNFNDRTNKNYGQVSFEDVYIGERAKDGNGGYTADFVAGTRVNLGKPVLGGVGTDAERYVLLNLSYRLEANKEYIISYAFTHTNTASHMGIGGSYLGTLTGGVGSYGPVSNQWSQNTPLDVYIKPEISADTPFFVYPGSSSETGLYSDYPLRDVWSWRHAEAHGAMPALIGMSGSTLEYWAGYNTYISRKFSTIARADKVIGNPGSNDVYGGASIADMKSRFESFAKFLRINIGGTFESADIFPRRTETAAIKAVREEFNAWLKTLPANTLVSHDRASVVSDANGLMRADFDSGDGTHLNTYGQHMLAASILVASGGGAPGPAGPAGPGVPEGGTAGQILRKDSTGQSTVWATLDGSVVGLGNVDNTADANKPVSVPQAAAIALKQNKLVKDPEGFYLIGG